MQLIMILNSGNPQTQLMAMVLTLQAIAQGSSAHILLCGEAADIALTDAPLAATAPQKPKGQHPQGMLMQIIAHAAAKVEVCAIYLPNKGVEASALIAGITQAEPAAMARRLIADDVRIMSF